MAHLYRAEIDLCGAGFSLHATLSRNGKVFPRRRLAVRIHNGGTDFCEPRLELRQPQERQVSDMETTVSLTVLDRRERNVV